MPVVWILRTPDGEIPIDPVCVIGRSADCEAPIDDPNASRRHAALRVVGADVVVEDLQSRNGTFVDGRLIGSPTTVSAGARIIIGHTLMTLLQTREDSAPPPLRRSVPPPSDFAPDSVHTNTVVPDRAMLARAQAMLAAGRIDECAGGAAIVMRRQSSLGPKAEDEFVRGVSELLVSLAQRTGDPRWLEGLFQVNTDCERVLAADLVAAIEALAPPGTVRLLAPYVAKLGARAAFLTPADRVLLARIERLA
jgi:pSer/pThr/pTyr-binding forkhead associated (FHA) protein